MFIPVSAQIRMGAGEGSNPPVGVRTSDWCMYDVLLRSEVQPSMLVWVVGSVSSVQTTRPGRAAFRFMIENISVGT